MKSIRNWDGLREYGVDCLTGEACAYGYRLLCDLTDDGVKLIRDVMDMADIPRLRSNWNSNGVASIMLPSEMLTPIAVFALFKANCKSVAIMYSGEVYGFEEKDSDESVADFIKWQQGRFCDECKRYGAGGGIMRQVYNPGYSRNVHQMSGRTA